MQGKAISNNTWILTENVQHLLAPLEQFTRGLSAYDACISAVLPGILGLKLTLEADGRWWYKDNEGWTSQCLGRTF
jgi:hypothetical protein